MQFVEEAVSEAATHLRDADFVLVSAGAGLSIPAGISYADCQCFSKLMPGLTKQPDAPQCFWDCMGRLRTMDERERVAIFAIWGHFMTTHGRSPHHLITKSRVDTPHLSTGASPEPLSLILRRD